MKNHFTEHNVENEEVKILCPVCNEITTFVVIKECYCNVDLNGCGYTYDDEYGPCDFCEGDPVICLKCNGPFTEKEILIGGKKN